MGLAADADVVLLGRIDTPGAAGDAEADADAGLLRGRRGDLGGAVRPTRRRRTRCSPPAGSPTPRWSGWARCSPRTCACPSAAVPDDARAHRGDRPSGTTSLIANIAHAGDGNLHPLLITPPRRRRRPGAAPRPAFDEIIAAALALGGTVTGEHGVGLLKRDGLAAELAPAVLEMHRAVKAALDPHGILNPGKVFTSTSR